MHASDTKPERFLGDYLFSELPCRLLVVGELPEELAGQAIADVEVHRLVSLGDAEAMGSHSTPRASQGDAVSESLVLQIDADSPSVEQRLGRAVRAFPHRVLVHFKVSEAYRGPSEETFFALGFRRLMIRPPGADNLGVASHWFEYRLSQYKASPDWLNARFWAHPERFDHTEEADEFEDDDEED